MADEQIRVGRRTVRLTSPEKVLFPKERFTKKDLAEYYAEVGPTLVPHLKNRPFTLKRFPIVVICQYDVRRFSGQALFSALRAHPDLFSQPLGPFLT